MNRRSIAFTSGGGISYKALKFSGMVQTKRIPFGYSDGDRLQTL